jgi:hypothetical protein
MIIYEDESTLLRDLASTPEGELVRAVFANRGWLRGIGNPPLTPGPIDWRLEADLSGLAAARGDVDALIVSRGLVFQARAVQFKRIKIGADSFVTGEMNNLKKLTKLVRQANLLHELGFAFVWATVIVVADMRSQVPARGLHPAPPRDLMDRVYAAFPWNELRAGVGVNICEIAQVSDQPAQHRGGAGSHMARTAIEQNQSAALTSAIGRVFNPAATESSLVS